MWSSTVNFDLRQHLEHTLISSESDSLQDPESRLQEDQSEACDKHLVINSRRRRDQSGTEGRDAVLQDLFSHKRNSSADVVRGLREVDAESSWREKTEQTANKQSAFPHCCYLHLFH